MNKIKYIHCFGTSHTAGGGFEFDSENPERNEALNKLYSKLEIPRKQFDYSFPGQLQSFIDKDIKVYNHAKQGYGNDRIYRIVYDIVNEIGFNSEENIFIFEFAGIGRKEYYCNQLQNYITINWQHNTNENGNVTKTGAELMGVAESYFYETQQTYDFVTENKSFFETYIKTFVNFDYEFKNISREVEYFLAYIEKVKLNYYFTSPPIVSLNGHDRSKEIFFGDGKFFKKSNSILDFSWDNDLIITKETNGEYDDLHNSLKSNKLVAHIIYNKLIDDGYIPHQKTDIDWEWYHTIDLLTKNKIL